MSSSNSEEQIDLELEALEDKAMNFIMTNKFATAYRTYGELRRRARTDKRARAYIIGTFFQMNQATSNLDFQASRERAIELIAILQNEEQLRQIQSDYSQDMYDFHVFRMLPCGYEHLADATGQLDGYNSAGLHACISDGIQICRRTGKTQCITCFREYACDVYLSADDPDIAAYQCRMNMNHQGEWSDRGDCRWQAAIKLAWTELLYGKFDEAMSAIEQGLEFVLVPEVAEKQDPRRQVLHMRDTIRLAMNLEPIKHLDELCEEDPLPEEFLDYTHKKDLNTSLQAAMCEDWNRADELLKVWDQRFKSTNHLHKWFETRLRRVAIQILSGNTRQAGLLANELEQKARVASDFLTLRRLQLLQQSDTPLPWAPAALARKSANVTTGDNSQSAERSAPEPGGSTSDASATSTIDSGLIDQDGEAGIPVSEWVESLKERLYELIQTPSDEGFDSIQSAILEIDPVKAAVAQDAASVLRLAAFVVGNGEKGREIWTWANQIASPYRDNGEVLSSLAMIGDQIRAGDPEKLQEIVTVERTEQLFRKSLELDPDNPQIQLRAGKHFAGEDNLGDAEHCIARAFRLDRTDGGIVRALADVYSATDRPRDALHVLDLSLREGCDDPQVAHDAAMLSRRLGSFEISLSYLDKLESLIGEEAATNYFRSICHFELGKFQESLDCVNAEERISGSNGWHLEMLRCVCLARLGDTVRSATHFQRVMDTPLFEVDFLSPAALSEHLFRLLVVTDEVFGDKVMTSAVESRLLRSGLMPEKWYAQKRQDDTSAPVDGLHIFRCYLRQPLDPGWLSDSDRLSDQESWPAYYAEWGVLAESDEAAAVMAVAAQSRCYGHMASEAIDVGVANETYCDIPGVVWQGGRQSVDDVDLTP